MKMTAGRRALDKIYKRRDRYEIPEWQRGEVWNNERKQQLIDSILRGWKLPKFYFLKTDDDSYEVVDGQQRLSAIYDFFANELALGQEASTQHGGLYYKDLKQKSSDGFDDFEIEFDEIEDAGEEELKQFFQRLQQGLPLSSSEKLNSIHSKLRDFCRACMRHDFFQKTVHVANTRLAHFDIATKVAAIEVEGIDTGLRYEDIKAVFESQTSFSSTSAIAKRIKLALDFLSSAFPENEATLKNRTIIQSTITLACRLIETGRSKGMEAAFASFIRWFLSELSNQVELGQGATDHDFIRYQKSINANVKVGARIRQEIMLRKAFLHSDALANAFDNTSIQTSGLQARPKELADIISNQIHRLNATYSANHGNDLFKPTNKTVKALTSIGMPAKGLDDYKEFISNLYFLFRESVGQRLDSQPPQSFIDINTLRTDLQHDVDHGEAKKVKKKRKNIGSVFEQHAGVKSPELLDSSRFILVQINILSALELDLRNLILPSQE